MDGLSVRRGEILGEVVENSFTGLALSLRFHIRLDLEPAVISDGPRSVSATLGPFDFGVRNWSSLQGLRWAQPAHPEMILADGEEIVARPQGGGRLDLGEASVPLVCEGLEFGALAADGLDATLEVKVAADPTAQGGLARRFQLRLAIGPIRVIGDMFKLRRPKSREARALAAEVLDLEAFDMRREGDVACLYPRTAGGPARGRNHD